MIRILLITRFTIYLSYNQNKQEETIVYLKDCAKLHIVSMILNDDFAKEFNCWTRWIFSFQEENSSLL